MEIRKKIVSSRTETHELTLDGEEIRQLIASTVGVPADAVMQVSFHVPSGGDWSNVTIDIDQEHPIYVTWTTVETMEERDGS